MIWGTVFAVMAARDDVPLFVRLYRIDEKRDEVRQELVQKRGELDLARRGAHFRSQDPTLLFELEQDVAQLSDRLDRIMAHRAAVISEYAARNAAR